ncbi:MAG: 5-formyltetrahydrofolate cyclo-ligase [Treponema sp.]|nr:5-formyltetrahydrofolate cyclo-ligase [Treponema sp.]
MSAVSEQKKALRKQMARVLSDFAETNDCVSVSEAVRRLVLKSGLVEKADIVLGYLFHGNEADCTDVLYRALGMQKLTGLPRVVPGTSDMDFYLLDGMLNFGDQIGRGSYGISEPVPSLEKLELSDALSGKRVLMIVPGVAFTKDGKRLGHGKGFYDRYIARLRATGAEVTLAGFCFPCQVVSDVPTDENDVLMDMVFGA